MPYSEASQMVQQSIHSRTRAIFITLLIALLMFVSFIGFSVFNLLRIDKNARHIDNIVAEADCIDRRESAYLIAIGDIIEDSANDTVNEDNFNEFIRTREELRKVYYNPDNDEPWADDDGPCDLEK